MGVEVESGVGLKVGWGEVGWKVGWGLKVGG